MPIYEYECLSCQHKLEVMQKLNDPAPSCPECGGKVKKLISTPAVHFKGSGWYVTDYASKGGAKGASKEDGGKADGGGGSSGSAEASSAKGSDAGAGKSDSGQASTAKASSTAKE